MDISRFCVELTKGNLDDQISDIEQRAKYQIAYTHPLKPATAAKQHRLGAHNQKAVSLLRELQAHLRSLPPDLAEEEQL